MGKLLDAARAVDILQVVDALGLKRTRAGSRWFIRCQVHDDKTASCHIDTAGKYANRWYCQGCEAKGDAVDLWQAVTRATWEDAARAVVALGGGAMPEPEASAKPKPAAAADSVKFREVFSQIYAAYLSAITVVPAGNYIAARGLSGIAEPAGVRGVVLPGGDYDNIRNALSFFRAEDVKAAGLGYGHYIWPGDGRWLILPIYHNGQPIYLQARIIEGGGNKYKNLPDLPKPLFGVDQIPGPGGRVVLSEGIIDALSWRAMGYKACAILGANDWKKHFAQRFAGRVVWVAMDADRAGREAVEAIEADLIEAGALEAVPYDFEPYGVKDANEMLLKRHAEKASPLERMQAVNPVLSQLVNTFSLKQC